MTDIDRGTLEALLTAFEQRLRAKVPGLNDANCFVSDHWTPPQILHELTCTISIGDGKFDGLLFTGGGHMTLAEDTTVLVTLFRRCLLDGNERTRAGLLQPEAGLLTRYKPLLLHTLLVEGEGAWEPLYNGDRFLRDSLQPLTCTAPMSLKDTGGNGYLYLQLAVRAYFDWAF